MGRYLCAVAAMLALGLATAAERPDEVSDAQALARKGAHAEALARVEAILKKEPKDPRARFLKGVILTEQKKPDEAIAVFLALNEDMPELPEPYNNLGVLYAAQGRYEESRRALELAILAHPEYALAHENLGDIYARMAAQSYQRARKIDPKSAALPVKLKLIDQLLTPAGK
jgi:Flp pilus assembly protein TadD